MSDILNLKKYQEPCNVLENYINVKDNYYFDINSNDNTFGLNYRNNKWLKILETEIKVNSCFIAVGASRRCKKQMRP
jgi:hypothetical protein